MSAAFFKSGFFSRGVFDISANPLTKTVRTLPRLASFQVAHLGQPWRLDQSGIDRIAPRLGYSSPSTNRSALTRHAGKLISCSPKARRVCRPWQGGTQLALMFDGDPAHLRRAEKQTGLLGVQFQTRETFPSLAMEHSSASTNPCRSFSSKFRQSRSATPSCMQLSEGLVLMDCIVLSGSAIQRR